MGKNRRSVSLPGALYDRAQAVAITRGKTISALVAEAVRQDVGMEASTPAAEEGTPPAAAEPAPPVAPPKKRHGAYACQCCMQRAMRPGRKCGDCFACKCIDGTWVRAGSCPAQSRPTSTKAAGPVVATSGKDDPDRSGRATTPVAPKPREMPDPWETP